MSLPIIILLSVLSITLFFLLTPRVISDSPAAAALFALAVLFIIMSILL
jgi:hypothetical protein